MHLFHDLWSSVLHEGERLQSDFQNLREKFDLKVEHLMANPGLVRPIFSVLREHAPIFRAPRLVIVSRYDDVVEVLDHDDAFGTSQIYLEKMKSTAGVFVLGLPDSPQYHREIGLMRQATARGDLDNIRRTMTTVANDLVAAHAASGRIELVSGLTHLVPMRFCGSYFGTPGDDEPTTMRWLRSIFREIFLNLSNDPVILAKAVADAKDLNAYLDRTIAARKALGAETGYGPDDFLGRLLRLQATSTEPIDDSVIRRIIGGTIIGTVDNISKVVAQVIDILLDRPDALALAQKSAREDDDALLTRCLFEALRFNPQNPLMLRHCERTYTIAANTPRATTIEPGTRVIVGTESAMFDPDAFPAPDSFRIDRPPEKYLHFGHGLHECFGGHISKVLVPLIAKPLLRLPRLRRAPGNDGKLAFDGAFPSRLIVEFDV